MQNQFDNQPESRPPTLKEVVAFFAVMFLLCAVVLGVLLKTQADARAQAETQRVALAKVETEKVAQLAKLRAPKVGKIKSKRKTKMIKIAIGTNDQKADKKDTSPIPNPGCGGGQYLQSGGWEIKSSGTVIAGYKNAFSEYTGQVGWGVSSGGIITVPVDASPGFYIAEYSPGVGMCDPLNDEDEIWVYEFEVVCMKVRIIG